LVRYLEFIKAICKQSDMWELYNPRVIGLVHNIIQCVQNDDEVDRETREYVINLVLSNLIIFSKYNIYESLEESE